MSGRFVLTPPSEFRMLMYVMAHRQFHWCLGAMYGASVLYSGPFRDYSLHDSGPVWDYSFTCELHEQELSCGAPEKLRRIPQP